MQGLSVAGRRRPAVCDPCRKRKLRCDRNLPCSMCVRSRREECTYARGHRGATVTSVASQVPSHAQRQNAIELGSLPTAPAPAPAQPSAALEVRPSRPSDNLTVPSSPETEITSSLPIGTWYNSKLGSVYISEHSPDGTQSNSSSNGVTSTAIALRPANQPKGYSERGNMEGCPEREKWIMSLPGVANPVRGIMFKGKYLGQSHWLQSMMLVPRVVLYMHQGPTRAGSETWKLLNECKALARQLKLQRQPQTWEAECGKFFPPRPICDRLLEIYISNFESVHRVVHVPSLISEYERHWRNPTATDTFVLLNIQLCLALGCYLYDDTFSLRAIVEQWIHEAKTALVTLGRTPSSIVGLQLLCLLYFVRRFYKGKWGPPVWISGGTVYQAAVSAGLHIDPSKLPEVSAFEAEMRRRLWMTILEIQLESSLDASTPPLLLLDDHDCEAPLNLDDDQLDPAINSTPAAWPADVFTNTSLQILFGESLMLRLKIVKVVNNSRSQATYGEVLRLTSDLEDAMRKMTSRIASYGSVVTSFQKQWCELLMRRCFMVLHLPYMQLALKNPLYYFSRKVCVDNAIKLSYAFTSPRDGDKTLEALRTAANIEHSCDEYLRLNYSTAGCMRIMLLQCSFILGAELLALIDEDTSSDKKGSYGAGLTGGNLQIAQIQALLRGAGNCVANRLRAGHSNVKDYTAIIFILADAKVSMSGSVPDDAQHGEVLEAFQFAASILRDRIFGELSLDNIVMSFARTNQDMDPAGSFWLDQM